MTTQLIKIGNSRGVLLPKSIIERAKLEGQLHIDLTDDGIIIKSIRSSRRKKWAEKFRKETRARQPLQLGAFGNDFDKKEWDWK